MAREQQMRVHLMPARSHARAALGSLDGPQLPWWGYCPGRVVAEDDIVEGGFPYQRRKQPVIAIDETSINDRTQSAPRRQKGGAICSTREWKPGPYLPRTLGPSLRIKAPSGTGFCQGRQGGSNARQRHGHLLRTLVLGREDKIHLLARLRLALQVDGHLYGAITELRQACLDRHGIGLVGIDPDDDTAGLNRIWRQLHDQRQLLVGPGAAHHDTRHDRRGVGLAVRLVMNKADLLACT